MLMLPLPYFLGKFNIWYLVIVLNGVLPVLIFSTVMIWRFTESEEWRRLSMILKYDMIVGLVALIIGKPI